MIRILNADYQRLGVVKSAIEAAVIEELNGEYTLEFTSVLDEKISNLVSDNTIFEVANDYFDIARLIKHSNDDGTYTVEVETEHISYRLNDPKYDVESFLGVGNPTQVLAQILQGTELTVGTVEIAQMPHEYDIRDTRSRRRLLMDFVDMLGGEVLFNRFEVSIYVKRGDQTAKAAIKGNNVRVISRELNKRKFDGDGAPLISYTCQPLNLPRNEYELGDAVRVIDRAIGVREDLRVVRFGYNPYLPTEVTLVFGVYINGFERQFHEMEHAIEDAGGELTDEELEEIIDRVTENVKEEIQDIVSHDYFTLYDAVETNFDAIDVTKPFPAEGRRKFYRVEGPESVNFMESILEEDDRIIDEDDERTRFNQLKDRNGALVYWVTIPVTATNRMMTYADPVVRFPPDYPDGATPEEKEEIRAELRWKYAVKIRKAKSERIISSLDNTDEGFYIGRIPQQEEEDDDDNGVVKMEGFSYDTPNPGDGGGNNDDSEPIEKPNMGIRLTDDRIQYTRPVSGRWVDMGGHVISDSGGAEYPSRMRLQFKGNVEIQDDSESDGTKVIVGGGDPGDNVDPEQPEDLYFGKFAGRAIILDRVPTREIVEAAVGIWKDYDIIYVYDPDRPFTPLQ